MLDYLDKKKKELEISLVELKRIEEVKIQEADAASINVHRMDAALAQINYMIKELTDKKEDNGSSKTTSTTTE